MKKLFLHAKYNKEFILSNDIISKLPGKIALCTTIQYVESINYIKTELENNNKSVIVVKGIHSSCDGQILGCDITNGAIEQIKLNQNDFDAFLFIGDGLFHPKMLLFAQINNSESGSFKDVFLYNPKTSKLSKINKDDIKNIEKKYKGALLKFLTSKNIGILVSTKPGQERLKLALDLKKKWMKKGKNVFILMSDTLDFNSLQDFSFIDCFVNTMCPRIGFDDTIRSFCPIINYDELDDMDF
jgi:2-(3-amino-3-carboxypropyl)histidine synthase